LVNARAEIASLQERNKTLFNLKKESDILFEKEKSALEHNINKSKLMVWNIYNNIFMYILSFCFNDFRLIS